MVLVVTVVIFKGKNYDNGSNLKGHNDRNGSIIKDNSNKLLEILKVEKS